MDSNLTHFPERRWRLIGLVALVLSMFVAVGMAIGFVSAASEMLGQAEVFPADAMPRAPDVVTYITWGGLLGFGIGVLASGLAISLAQRSRAGSKP